MKKNMMKKLFTAVMATVMVLAASTSAFAATTYEGTETNIDTNGLGTEVVYTATTGAANYIVWVPETLIIQDSKDPNLWEEGKQTGRIGVRGSATLPIKIIPDPTFTMTSAHGNHGIKANTVFEGLTLSPNYLVETAVETTISAEWGDKIPVVDTWEGTITYHIEV